MHIIHIAAELAPLAKVGGLADVVLGLCRELSWKGHDVDIILPKYDCMDSNQIGDLTIVTDNLMSYYHNEWHKNTVWKGWVENLKVYFIEPHHPHRFFQRGCYYGCEDDVERYLYFCRASLEFLFNKQIPCDIIHVHDWQTAAIPLLIKEIYENMGFNHAKTTLTIHNIEYQGRCSAFDLDRIGLKGDSYFTPEKLQDKVYPESLNLLKGGITYSNFITTVSPTYAREILTQELGFGLEDTLLKYTDKLKGILNGVDYSYWNPEIDRYLPAHYSSRELPRDKEDRHTLNKKGFIKKVLRERLGLSEKHKPIVGCVARLVPQKGIDLIKHAISYLVEQEAQFILLGTSPIPKISEEFFLLQQVYLNHPDVSLVLHHQEELAHQIFAGSDILIVPSLFEPCGLTQMIALKYGTIPVVRKTGGLSDTIIDVGSPTETGNANGYTFNDPTPQSFEATLHRAIRCWFDDPSKWWQLMIHGMNIDFSWNHPASHYLEIYQHLVSLNQELLQANEL
ncbi:glycogen synthase [Parachlamydia sp. AcF125]|uniref:glycogen synthase n=1 Tax=Parachlamydia sp. AcF125 TaxID=2795736 RepID=UPI001BCA38B0|nr:glycogen synthase [Parachlamydia sp. AcF125]MBS4168792.1 Glycogen synthase [Parachlamydia sp. AcF125]